LRQRLTLASGRVAAQRESLAHASAALDRAIECAARRGTAGCRLRQWRAGERAATSGCLHA
jgi:hypothetical protein